MEGEAPKEGEAPAKFANAALRKLGERDYFEFTLARNGAAQRVGDIQLTLAQKVPVTGAVIVTTPQDIALLDARKGLKMFQKVDVPVLGIIENMSWFTGDDGKRYEIFGAGGGKELADDLGVKLDEVRERHEKWVTPEPISCTMMNVEPGKVAAVRFGVEGVRDGRVVITMEHVNRLTEAAAPDWAFPPDGRPGVHRVVIEGDPGVEINTHVGGLGTDHNQGGVIATAARPINAIEAVCRAPAGILAAHDLRPLDHTRGVMW